MKKLMKYSILILRMKNQKLKMNKIMIQNMMQLIALTEMMRPIVLKKKCRMKLLMKPMMSVKIVMQL